MIYAILSDVHGNVSALNATLDDARRRGATEFIALGDLGGDPCCNLLRTVGAQGAFGNYEVSGWDRLAPENQQWVQSLPGVLAGDIWLAAHAAPFFPAGVADIHQVLDYLLEQQVKWRTLFPDLVQDEHARWLAFAELEAQDKAVFFHGHTHLQRIWRVGANNVMTPIREKAIGVERANRYIIGVGSVGQPMEEKYPSYGLYDSVARRIELRRAG